MRVFYMGRKELIIVTLLFMLVIGTILFFTLMNLNKSEEFKFSITGSSTYEERPVVRNEVKNEDFIQRCNKGCN